MSEECKLHNQRQRVRSDREREGKEHARENTFSNFIMNTFSVDLIYYHTCN